VDARTTIENEAAYELVEEHEHYRLVRAMNAPLTSIAFELLPADMRSRLEALGAKGRGPFGRVQTQEIVDAHLDVLMWLRKEGASHAQLAELIQTLGITTREGQPLSAATISSAISRARASSGPRNRKHVAGVRQARAPIAPSPQVSSKQVGTPVVNSQAAAPSPAALVATTAATEAGAEEVLPQPSPLAKAAAVSARDSPPLIVRHDVRREILLTLLDQSEEE
jgi:uncharacterized protein (DUF3820 family)